MKKFLLIFTLFCFFCIAATAQQNQSSCSNIEYTNQSPACFELHEGAEAYKERKFQTAEEHFTRAKEIDPNLRIVSVFLARTLHQQYLANRAQQENQNKAQQAIELYRRILTENPNDEAADDAISSLIGQIDGAEALLEWRMKRADDNQVNAQNRAKALTFLAADKYRCVTNFTEAAKRVIKKDNETVYVFRKPKNLQKFEEAKRCAEEGIVLIDKALKLDAEKSSPWSYKTSLLIQKARLAEMENNFADKERFQLEAESFKKRFVELSEQEAEKHRLENEDKSNKEN